MRAAGRASGATLPLRIPSAGWEAAIPSTTALSRLQCRVPIDNRGKCSYTTFGRLRPRAASRQALVQIVPSPQGPCFGGEMPTTITHQVCLLTQNMATHLPHSLHYDPVLDRPQA